MLYRICLLSFVCLISSAMVASEGTAYASERQSVELFEFETPGQQKQAIELAKTLRCPMCQNQNLIESNSPVAKDIRLKVFQLVKAGKTEQEVKDFMVARYGEHVLYKPSLSRQNALLWGLPVILGLSIVIFMLRSVIRTKKQ